MRVTLDIYSGRENPSWDLSESDARQLVDRVAGKTLAAVNEVEGVLGFRGYIISVAEDADETAKVAGLPWDFRMGGTMPQQFLPPEAVELTTLSPAEVEDTAQWLLTTARQAVDEEIVTMVQGGIRQEPQPQLEAVVAAACVIQNTPYNPGFWNTPSVQPYNNCYNYAMNYRSNTFAQPGGSRDIRTTSCNVRTSPLRQTGMDAQLPAQAPTRMWLWSSGPAVTIIGTGCIRTVFGAISLEERPQEIQITVGASSKAR